VTTSALRDIDKVGGLDQYLTKNTFQDVLGQRGQLLRERVLKAREEVAQKEQVKESVKKVVTQLPSLSASTSTPARRRS
jgi:ribosomal protein L28